jgi:hypothetical protein
MAGKKHWHSTLELLKHAYLLPEFTLERVQNSKCNIYQAMFTTQDDWTIMKYVMEVLRPFRYSTLWMSKRHTVTLHHVITVYNDNLDHIIVLMQALAEKKTEWKEDWFFAVKLARQKLSKYSAEATPTTDMVLISAQILHPFRKLRSVRKWDKGMDINPEDDKSYTTQYPKPFLKSVENEY